VNSKTPLVTVLIPVYNGAKFLGEAIESILNQTLEDFELLIIDDGSTDNCVDIIRGYHDSRIRLVENDKNLGQAETMNRGLHLAKGKYIARMDQDDVSLSSRLRKQVAYMENNLQVGVCGTWIKYIGYKDDVLNLETKNHLIKLRLLTNQSLAHPTVMIRRSVLDDYNLKYDGRYSPAEDYDLWVRMSDYCSFANLPEPLVRYRLHENQGSEIGMKQQSDSANQVRSRLIESMGLHLQHGDLLIHNTVFCEEDPCSLTISEVFSYLMRLHYANQQNHVFQLVAFDEFIKSNWLRFMANVDLRIRVKGLKQLLVPRASFWGIGDRLTFLFRLAHS